MIAMQRMMKSALTLVVLAPIFGCGNYDPELVDDIEVVRHEYEAVRAMTPHGPKFNQGLRQGYLDYGDLQYDTSDYGEFVHFAFKAVDSAKGENVLPDEIASRTIPANLVDEFSLSRARLMGALEQGGRRNAPWKAAEAQTAFDCWLERTEEGAEACDDRGMQGPVSRKRLQLSKAALRVKQAVRIWCSSPLIRQI